MLPTKSSNQRLSFDNFDDAVSKKFKIKRYLRETLSENYKNCLLVLLDVPNQLTLRSFELECKILMTTRNKEVCKPFFLRPIRNGAFQFRVQLQLLDILPTKTTKSVQLSQGFETEESLGLFAKVLGIQYKELPSEAAEIHRLCKGNPFLISLIAGNMKEYANTTNRWMKWKSILENIR